VSVCFGPKLLAARGHMWFPMAMDRADRAEKIRWGWILLCELCGAALIGTAFLVEDRWQWKGVSTDTLVNLGTAFALAGILFFFERRFTRRVIQASARVASEIRAEFQAETQTLRRRVDDLQTGLEDRLKQRASRQDEAIASLEDVSFETVTSALEAANRLSALAEGKVTVQAARDPDGLGLIFGWGMDRSGESEDPRPVLEIEARIEADLDRRGGRAVIEVEWQPGEDPTVVGERLVERLQQAGRWEGDDTLDWSLALRNLQRTLELAVSARRRDAGAWELRGPLYEVVDGEWAITEAGLECYPHGYFLAEEDFPNRGFPGPGVGRLEPQKPWPPRRPEWCDDNTWERVLRRGQRLFPFGFLARTRLYSSSWTPRTGETDQ
jgi:hypothetical protein